MDNKVDEISQKIIASKKYSRIYPGTIRRIVKNNISKYPEKLVENKSRDNLHQVWGSFYKSLPDYRKLNENFTESMKNGSTLKEALKPILFIHSSTAERLPILDSFYKKIWEITGIPNSVFDLACGFNPLTLPWMDLPAASMYHARDIDISEIEFLNEIISKVKLPLSIDIKPGDIFEDEVFDADVVMLLKALPSIEAQSKGAAEKLIKQLNTKWLVISYPVKSIGGKEKGMLENYRKQANELLGGNAVELEFETELVFVARKQA